MNFIKHILPISILLLGFTSCLKEKSIAPIEVLEEDTTSFPCGDTVFFNSEIMTEILTPSCNTAGCHNSSASAGYDFTTYSSVNANASIILNVINHEDGVTPMPIGQNKLDDSLITKLDCWIQQGKINN